jgi:hypothetical protein
MIRISFRIRYPFRKSVAPPGTAWGAEGLRGNEANENKIMVLVRAAARKWQKGQGFAQGERVSLVDVSRCSTFLRRSSPSSGQLFNPA